MTKKKTVGKGIGATRVVLEVLEEWGENQLAHQLRERVVWHNENTEGFEPGVARAALGPDELEELEE